MKKFEFPLDRVLDWRRTQVRVEKSNLERLYSEMHGLDARKAALETARAESEQSLLVSGRATGQELAAFDKFSRFTVAERTRLEAVRVECSQRIAAQNQVLASRRRDVRLLERLRNQRLKDWESGFAREIDAQADEAYLAKWNS
jgi:flagellar export protein FliJ